MPELTAEKKSLRLTLREGHVALAAILEGRRRLFETLTTLDNYPDSSEKDWVEKAKSWPMENALYNEAAILLGSARLHVDNATDQDMFMHEVLPGTHAEEVLALFQIGTYALDGLPAETATA